MNPCGPHRKIQDLGTGPLCKDQDLSPTVERKNGKSNPPGHGGSTGEEPPSGSPDEDEGWFASILGMG